MVGLKTAVVVPLAAVVVFGVARAHIPSAAGAPAPTARNQQSKDTAAPSDKSKTPGTGCLMLTPAMLEKVLGQPFDDPSESKMWPAYQGAWGSNCEYSSKKPSSQGGVRVDFLVYTEASAAEAKQTFDKAAVFFTDRSKPKLSIGDSAYWDSTENKEPKIHVLKGKVHYSLGMQPANEKQLKDLAAAVAAGI
jgi:hypothetical protein